FGVALDEAIAYAAAGNGTNFRDTEGFQNFRAALIVFLEYRFEQAGHGTLDFILQLVNDRVQADIHFFLIRQFLSFALRAHVEPDDDGVRSGSQKHVTFGNRTHARAQHTEADFVVRELSQQVSQHFNRTLHVALQDNVQLFHARRLQLLGQPFKRYAGTLGQGGFACLLLAIVGDAAGFIAVSKHGADFSVHVSDDEVIAGAERAVLNE